MDNIEHVFWGSLSTIFFLTLFLLFIIGPMLAVFLIVWVLTQNVPAAVILGIVTEAVYIWYVGEK